MHGSSFTLTEYYVFFGVMVEVVGVKELETSSEILGVFFG